MSVGVLVGVAVEVEPVIPLAFPLTRNGSSVQMSPQETPGAQAQEPSTAAAVAPPVSLRRLTSPWAM